MINQANEIIESAKKYGKRLVKIGIISGSLFGTLQSCHQGKNIKKIEYDAKEKNSRDSMLIDASPTEYQDVVTPSQLQHNLDKKEIG